MTYAEVADTLEDFVEHRGDKWDWENYMSATFFEDDYLRQIQNRMIHLSDEFPPGKEGGFCNSEGIEVIRKYIHELRMKTSAPIKD